MQRIDGAFIYAASDLNNYLECKRLTELETLVACGKRVRPSDAEDEQTRLIRRKGEEHERRFLETMQSLNGGRIVSIERPEPSLAAFARAEQQTFEAMAAGAPIVYQATFFDGLFIGHADFLRRIDAPSRLGAWSYEVLDTKLALNPKPYFLIQLCNYAEHLERLQGVPVVHGCVILGDGTEARYRLHDYAAYYRHLKSTFLAFAADAARTDGIEPAEYPYECKHCTMCAWDGVCKQRRIDDDHLSLVAWMRRDQIAKLETAGIASLATLAHAGDEARPQGLNGETFQKLRRQARLQADGRERGAVVYELLPHAPPMGFTLMPEPARGDVFFDMEGDPLFEPGHGLEYLFGCWLPDDPVAFRSFWGLDRRTEKRAFEEFVDFVVARRRRYPSMHVYHYASYEKSAVRKLAQAHCTRESEIDDLLRGEVLVDLYAVVRQALAISEERYGLKNLERFYPLVRATEVKKGDQSIVMFERWLETGERSILDDIEAYNRDDCESTYWLREWLLARRDESIQHFGVQLPFRPFRLPSDRCHPDFLEGCSKCAKRRSDEREEARRSDLERTLLQNLLPPQSEDDYRAMAEDARARYLLGNLLAYHRREEKPGWWAYFDRCENVDHLLDDREAIGGLKLDESVAPYKHNRSWVYTYSFPDQHHKLGKDDTPHDPTARKAGTIIALDEDGERNVLAFKWNGNLESARAIVALIPRPPLATKVQRESLERIAGGLVAGTLRHERPATFDLLTSAAPRIADIPSGSSVQPQPVTAEAVSSVVRSLDRSYLFIQGPPGSGKTTTAAHVICDLLQSGNRVGVTSTGHKAIHNLLDKVESEMRARHARFRGLYKCSNNNPGSRYESDSATPFVENATENAAFDGLDYDLAAGTSWLFARPELAGSFDYLFIDEAGQVSLADALAVSACAHNVVLLGDPSQLAQVSQGVHPLHAGDSVLQHVLGEAQTIPEERGIFLDVSYRMHPEICAYVSDATYDGRLEPDPRTRLHSISVAGRQRSGLEYLPVEHSGNASSSPEEAARIVQEILLLRAGEVTDSLPPGQSGIPRALTDRDVIVVTPYNAQRRLLTNELRKHGLAVEVGTVDKFQGREAAVVFYSMAASSGEDVPRDLQFLFERNRFNVAISRARALSVLVCSPRLLDVACRTIEQMALANLLCDFAERASAERPAGHPKHLGIRLPGGGL